MARHCPDDLLEMAREAAARAYAPYSEFPVGAALLAADGRVFTACNVENASYGLSICAERAALACAVSAGSRKFVRLAVVGGNTQPACPCGACLQMLSEFCDPDFRIVLAPLATRRKPKHKRLGDLLPCAFRIT